MTAPRRRASLRDGIDRLVQSLAPGGRALGMRRLRGGLGAQMHVMLIEQADGSRFSVSLRRFNDGEYRHNTPEHAAHEFETLRTIEAAAILAPRPLLLDAQGEYFGCPAMVMSYVPGRPLVESNEVHDWGRGLAEMILGVHEVSPQHFDLSALEVRLKDATREQIARRGGELKDFDPLAGEVHAALTTGLDGIEWMAPSLIHDDYWPGNVVWYRGRPSAIIDWTTAKVGDRRADVAQCRVDLVLIHGLDAADAFLEAYESASASALPDVWYFDLLRGLAALLYYDKYLDGYRDIGLTSLTLADMEARLRAFLYRALEQRR